MKHLHRFALAKLAKNIENRHFKLAGPSSLRKWYASLHTNSNTYLPSLRHFGLWGSSNPKNEWSKAVSEAEKIVGYPTSFMSLRCLLSDELSNVAMEMRKLVGTKHPLLKTARKFLNDGNHSMQTRGLLVLLVAKAAGQSSAKGSESLEPMVSGIYPSQRSLAEITEMIHTANMIHKGVVNLSDLQPSDGSLKDMQFGNKMAVLSGDFLLANASTALGELENTYVVELISGAIGDLMKAEFTHFRDINGNPTLPANVTVEDWETQTFLSSGSLIANSCKSALLLAYHTQELQDRAFEFGKHISFSRQLYEDLQPFTSASDENNNNNNGINVTSAPFVLYSAKFKDSSVVQDLVSKRLDSDKVARILKDSQVIEETKQFCVDHGQRATKALDNFPTSNAKEALLKIIKAVTAV